MRYLVFLRGVPGSGKSTFVRENNLEPLTISSDKIRLLLKPPVLSVTGKRVLSQQINRRVWGLIYSLIESRMEDGDFKFLTQRMQEMQILQSTGSLSEITGIRLSVLIFRISPLKLQRRETEKGLNTKLCLKL